MRRINGVATFPMHGEFEWRGYHINNGEYISLNWERDVKNFEHISNDGTAIVICPVCKEESQLWLIYIERTDLFE